MSEQRGKDADRATGEAAVPAGSAKAPPIDSVVQSIAAQIPDNLMVLDLEARIRFINWTVPDLEPERVIGSKVHAFVPEQHHAGMTRCFERVIETDEPDRYETTYVAEDGSLSFWESRVGAVRLDGEIVGFAVVSSNVTERRAAAADRDHFFNLSMDMLGVAGPDGYFKRLNPAFEATLGWRGDELSAVPFLEFVHPDDRERTREAMRQLESGHHVVDFENRYRRKDGAYRWVQWRSVWDSSRKLVHAVGRDVTEQKHLEAQLREAQKMDAIGRLAGGIAHDFNNLILAIQGNVLFARREADVDRRNEYLDEVDQAAQRAADLTRQLLTFGRRRPMNPVSLDLNELVTNLMKLLRRLIPENIDIDFIPGHELDFVHADPGQIEQVVVNLCVNARDAMPEGGTLTIEAENVRINGAFREAHPWARAGRYVLLSVTDTGEGMHPEVKERIFEPFFSTKEPGRGTGLGLATVYGIVQSHQGLVHVYTEPGKGTTFKVYLPVSERRAETIGSKLEGPVTGGDETILVAEDEASVRSIVVRILEDAGYRVVVATDGGDALRVFDRHREEVALALLDVVMPVRGGVDVAKALARERPGLPVILTSGYSDSTAKRLGVEIVLEKPYEPADLLRLLRQVLDRKEQA